MSVNIPNVHLTNIYYRVVRTITVKKNEKKQNRTPCMNYETYFSSRV